MNGKYLALSRLLLGLLRLEDSDVKNKMPAAMTKTRTSVYSYGLFIHPARERNTIEHAGNINGFNSAMAYYPNGDLIIIVLDNIEGTAADDIEGKIARLF